MSVCGARETNASVVSLMQTCARLRYREEAPMPAILLAVVLLGALTGEFQSESARSLSLVPAGGPNYSLRDGILELRGGRGWVRTERLFLNFRVAFEYRPLTPDADPGVFVRSWVSAQQGGDWRLWGYRLRLPTAARGRQPSALVGYERKFMVVEPAEIFFQPAEEWQTVEITGEGARVTVTLNKTPAGAFDLQEFGGYILFNNEKGDVQFRNVTISSTEREPALPSGVIALKDLKSVKGKAPKLVQEVKPKYTSDAIRAKVQGVVIMQVVVMPDGSTASARVTRSLHPDLDLSAVAAVRAWKFEPATVNDERVPVLVEVEMSFALQ
jgi:TonB family protein